EFVILSQNISDFEEYDDQIKRIINVFNYPFSLSTQERFISIRIGVALAPKDGKTTATILKHANVAMKNAKGRSRNTYIYFEEEMNNKITESIQMQSELRNGFEQNEFELYYEPIVSLSDNKIDGFEALVTWNHPTMGLLHPDEYMMHARDSSIVVPIGIWAFKLVCNQLKQWEESGYKDVNLSYYLSTLEFREPDIVETIWDIVNKNNISPENITLEISESTALDDIEYTILTINKLKELGIKFCLDKFGTKYISIKYINDLPLSSIKIDKALSKSVLEGTKEQNTLDAIINLIKTYKLDIIVEGVDRKEQELFLRKTNCDMAQGHVFSMPLLAEDTFKLLEEGSI
ncbi:MAG TPA: EAL domain-containing protein, partial [Clostridiales bacterium]|nr:EAL domain-containing protein [Clostridiales bacterium]